MPVFIKEVDLSQVVTQSVSGAHSMSTLSYTWEPSVACRAGLVASWPEVPSAESYEVFGAESSGRPIIDSAGCPSDPELQIRGNTTSICHVDEAAFAPIEPVADNELLLTSELGTLYGMTIIESPRISESLLTDTNTLTVSFTDTYDYSSYKQIRDAMTSWLESIKGFTSTVLGDFIFQPATPVEFLTIEFMIDVKDIVDGLQKDTQLERTKPTTKELFLKYGPGRRKV